MWKWKPLMNLVFHHFWVYLCSSRWKVIFLPFLQTKVRFNPASKKTLLSYCTGFIYHTQNLHSHAEKNPPQLQLFGLIQPHLYCLHELLLITFMKSRQRQHSSGWLMLGWDVSVIRSAGSLAFVQFLQDIFLIRLEIGCCLCVGSPQETRTVFSDACGLRRFWLPRGVIMHLCVGCLLLWRHPGVSESSPVSLSVAHT